MVELICVNVDFGNEVYPGRGLDECVEYRGRIIKTCATQLFPALERPLLDQCLRKLVCACTARDPNDRPSLDDLLNAALGMIAERDVQWYRDRGQTNPDFETDENIQKILRECTQDATAI